jgi:glycosyltransferase involved in cell wall biosynthesis
MKALVIAPQPFYTPRGTPLSVYYRTLITAELAGEVDLLTYGEGQDVAIDGVCIKRIPRLPFLHEIKVGPSYTKAILDVVLLAWAVALLVRNRYDVVHAHEEAVFFCRFLKPIFGFRLIYDMHSSLPQQLTNFAFTRSRLLIRAFERLEIAALRGSDAVITICPALAEQALALIDVRDKHFLIENSIFEDVRLAGGGQGAGAGQSDPGDLPPDLRPPDGRQVIVYAGTLEPYQGIDLLLGAFGLFRGACPEAFLLVVGGNPRQVETYSALARELEVAPHCRFTGQQPRALARRLCATAAVQVSPRTRGNNTPLKVYEQLASGVPLVATDIFSHRQVLDETVAFLAEPEPEDFARALREALSDPAAGALRVAAARRLYDEKYSRAAYVAKMRRLLERVA